MKKRTSVIIIIIFTLVVVFLSNTKNNIDTNKKKPLYEIYVMSDNELKHIKINSIKNNNIDYSKPKEISFQKNKLTIDSICPVNKNEIYCSAYKENGGQALSNKIALIKNGEIIKYIKTQKTGPNFMLSDLKNKRAYSMMAVRPCLSNKKGIPFTEIDTTKNIAKNSFNIKGEMNGFDIKDKYIYTTVVSANFLGFKNVPNNYIASINTDNNKVKVLTPKGLNFSPLGIKLIKNNKFYIVSDIIAEKQISDPKLSIYKKNGDFVKQIKLLPCCNSIEIDKKGMAYINHIGKKNQADFDGDTITVIDTNTDKKIETISGFNGCLDMYIKDNYLFVINFLGNDITVIDTNTRKKIGKINLGKDSNPTQLVVVKN